MNEEDEVDANGMPTHRAVESMALGVACAYDFYCDARAAGDASKTAYHADRVREEMGGLLQAVSKALGDDAPGAELDGPTPRTRMGQGEVAP